MIQKLNLLKKKLSGDLLFDETHLIIYSTDASIYKEKPMAVAFPKNISDIKELIIFANTEKTSLIPRGAGTSLAGQVVGNGIVVDVSRYLNKKGIPDGISKQISVQPGVILADLNKYLETFNLFFGPETSTANRCTIGGMVGNNSCGLRSLVYGNVRDYLHSVKVILSDGSEVVFKPLTKSEFETKCIGETLENKIYQNIKEKLSNKEIQIEIDNQYPDKEIKRRNTGYALDILKDSNIFYDTEKQFNFCNLIAGSEGTLAFITEITLNLIDTPPKNKILVVAHFSEQEHAFDANLIALKYNPTAVELADKTLLDLTKDSQGLLKNRFFIEGDPEAILIIEFVEEDRILMYDKARLMEIEMRENGFGYSFPIISGLDISKVWDLRKAGLGVLSNIPGDSAPVGFVEDTVVKPIDLPNYIKDFKILLSKYNLKCVYHAHIGAGELHLRPILNLKDKNEVEMLHTFAKETAVLVKKYRGSLSGEHGDGRLRGEFIPIMYGEKITRLFEEIKMVWDCDSIFNPGKIINTVPMNEFLRYNTGKKTNEFETFFDYSKTQGFIRAIEKCSGSADCIKSEIVGGTMCPSYKATGKESDTPRARANLLREILNNSQNPFENKELYNILDLCLSCKACKSECPSSVDITKFKAEYFQAYYSKSRASLRTILIANITKINSLLSLIPKLSNLILRKSIFSKLFLKFIGYTNQRQIPLLSKQTLKKYHKKNINSTKKENGKVFLFADEFTNYNETEIGIKTIKLLEKLGYEVEIPQIKESGRTYLSKGFLNKAKEIAKQNLKILEGKITKTTPLIGIEPSAILTFRDEYPDFFNSISETEFAFLSKEISQNTLLVEEFLVNEIKKGKITVEQFTKKHKATKFHGHCQQKAIANTDCSKFLLNFPENYKVEEISSGCCGMAGSFGYEKEHYELSMKIGEMILFPEIRNTQESIEIAASGTSCRHQILHGTSRESKHPVEILYEALI